MDFILLFAVLPKIWFYTRTFQDFCSDFCLVAAANRFKVLKIFISLKVTVYIQDHRLESEKALYAECFEWKSNCTEMAKYTCDFKHKIYCNIYI